MCGKSKEKGNCFSRSNLPRDVDLWRRRRRRWGGRYVGVGRYLGYK
jgi:hypothetical protein